MGEEREKRIAILAAIYAYLSRRRRAQAPRAGRGAALRAWRLARGLADDPTSGY